MIRFENVSKIYPRSSRPALDGVSVDIDRGEFVFVVGPSGSGKSTMLRLALREEAPTEGTVLVAGHDLGTMPARQVPRLRREMGAVFQDFRLLPNKTVHENVAYALQVIGKPGHLIRQLVPETLETVERIRRHYGLNLRMMTVAPHDEELWKVDPENCCSSVKVGQLDRALNGKLAWMSGLRRDEAASRSGAAIVGRDMRGLIKVNPLANWTQMDVDSYLSDHDVPHNPLLDQGYASIGCWPCTKPVEAGADPRSGRWAGRDKTECGLHLG